MAVMLFGGDATLAEALSRAGIQVASGPSGGTAEPGATAALASALRAAEEALTTEPPDAVVVAADGDEALAVALTAVKLGIPTAWLEPADAPADALVGRVADLRLDATTDVDAIATALTELRVSPTTADRA